MTTTPAVRLAPGGLLLGIRADRPVLLRPFAMRGTSVFLDAEEYVSWLLSFRAVGLGAQVTVITDEPHRWEVLAARIAAAGGVADVVRPGHALPPRGLPYRPSLVLADQPTDEPPAPGPWQSLWLLAPLAADTSVSRLRGCSAAVLSPPAQGGDLSLFDPLRRAYQLTASQLRAGQSVASGDVLVAMPRQLVRVPVRPSELEYAHLFDA